MHEDHKGQIIAAMTENIFRALQKQEFYDWFTTGKWESYITGDMEHDMDIAPSTAETLIKQDIQRMFNLV